MGFTAHQHKKAISRMKRGMVRSGDDLVMNMIHHEDLLRAPDKQGYLGYFKDIYSYFSLKTCCDGHLNHLDERVLMVKTYLLKENIENYP